MGTFAKWASMALGVAAVVALMFNINVVAVLVAAAVSVALMLYARHAQAPADQVPPADSFDGPSQVR